MMETGAHAIGCTVFAGGVGNTELQLQAMADLQPDAYFGTPSFLKILLEKAAETGVAMPSLQQGAGRRRGLPAVAARLAARARHRGLPVLRHRRRRPDRLRDRGARGPGARRGRDRRDRAPRHRRPGARRRGRRGGRHHAQPRLPAGPLRHRRPVGRAAGRLPDRAHQHAHQGLAGPRRPDGQGARHVRAPEPGGRDRAAPSRDAAARAW